MKSKFLTGFILTSMIVLSGLHSEAQFQFISPVPDSKYHPPQETIILRNGKSLEASSVHTKSLFKVTGSVSGVHQCEIRLVEGKKTIIAKPLIPFTAGEKVTVSVGEKIRTEQGEKVKGISFSFFIRKTWSAEDRKRIGIQMQEMEKEEYGGRDADHSPTRGAQGGFPSFTILTNTAPAAGQIFWHNFSSTNTGSAHYCIIENNGDSVYGKFDTVTFKSFDLNHNGYLTAYNRIDSVYEMFDSNYLHIATFQCGNGYKADQHEFQIYSDRQPYLIAFDPEIVDMTVYNSSYSPNATVVGLIIQQLDTEGNVIFQWRSWDHYEITDADHVVLSNAFIDAVHGNSLDVLSDGNILISARHLSELSKINRTTGDFIWRFGGANNQFNFTNDADKISWQHDARQLANGNLTVFDNGTYHTPVKTSVKEYQIDEVNKTATLVWSYSGNVISKSRGSAQKLTDGHFFISWGLSSDPDAPALTEVDSNGIIVWEMQINDDNKGMYRAHKYTWDPCARPSQSGVKAKKITPTSANISWSPATNATSYRVRYRVTGTQTWTTKGNIVKTNKKITSLIPGTKYDYEVRSNCNLNSPSSWTFVKTFTTKTQRDVAIAGVQDLQFDLYPNPCHSILNVGIDLNEAGDVILTVFDLSGRITCQSKRHAEAGKQSLTFNMDALTTEMYFAEVKAGGQRQIQKLVIE